jgi:hypothetical protein
MSEIKVNKNNSVHKAQWSKVESLPYGGQYANNHNGFNDHVDEKGNIYRVTFATWTTAKKVNLMGHIEQVNA